MIRQILESRAQDAYPLHERYLNTQMVRVLRTIGFDVSWARASGPYLFDTEGNRYLDLLSGFGVFALGRNHPVVLGALRETLEAETANLVQMGLPVLAGVLAERLTRKAPAGLEKVFFCNSGTEAAEAAMKFARYATGRTGFLHCERSWHGLTYGSLSLNGDDTFREGFGPLLPGCERIPFRDLEALERALHSRDVAAFFVEPIVGHGVFVPDDDYLPEAARLCRKYGTLLVADEIQTGLGRTGKFLAVEHWGVEPDMVLLAKALSGGFVPVGAVLCRKRVFDAVFDRMDRAVVHGSTFAKNDLAMAAGIATLEVLDQEDLVGNAARLGGALLAELQPLAARHELVKEVRGKGLMLGIEFHAPRSLRLKAAWKALEAANKGLFCQMVTIPLFRDHRILCQVAGHGLHVVKFLPPLVLSEADKDWIVSAVHDVVAACHRVPGAVWDLGKTLVRHAVRGKLASMRRG